LLQSGTQQILIDGGPDATVLQRLGEELPLLDRKIDVVVATHPDKDHIGGLVHVLERYEVGLVLLPEVAHISQLQSAWLDHIKEVMTQKGTEYRFAAADQQVHLNGVDMHVLHPQIGQAFGKKTNNGSVSARADFCPQNPSGLRPPPLVQPSLKLRPASREEFPPASPREAQGRSGDKGERKGVCLSLLLTGDAEAVTERQLVVEYGSELDVDILKAGHHGSKTSSSPEFLEAVSPKAVVISAGRDNQYGHPHPDVMERLKNYRLWRTDEQGSVRFTWNRGQWLASTTK
jgi:competence protein ComEC